MGDRVIQLWRAAALAVRRKLGNWMDDSGTNKADIADIVLPILAAGLGVASTILWELAPTDEGWEALKKVETYVAIVVSVGTLIVAGMAAKRSISTRKDARAAIGGFSNSLAGAADAVDVLMRSGRSLADGDSFIDAMLQQATTLMPISQCRATLYSLEERETDVENGSFYLKRVGRSKGRPDRGRPQFSPGAAHADAIIQIVRDGNPRFVDNHRSCDFPLDRDKEAAWRSFCVIPVSTPDGVWGALFLDSDKKNDFTSDKKAVAKSIARFVEIGIELLTSAAHDVEPELEEAKVQLGGLAHFVVSGASYTSGSEGG